MTSAHRGITCTDNWLVWLRREDGSLSFNRKWVEYVRGFGIPQEEFWLGLKHLHSLTSTWDYTLRVDLTDFEDRETFAEYETFKVGSESDKYELKIGGYQSYSTAGDRLTRAASDDVLPDGMAFSTKDSDNDLRSSRPACADIHSGGWWFRRCTAVNPTGVYGKDTGKNFVSNKHVHWYSEYEHSQQVKKMEFKIKAKPGAPCDGLMAKADDMVNMQTHYWSLSRAEFA